MGIWTRNVLFLRRQGQRERAEETIKKWASNGDGICISSLLVFRMTLVLATSKTV